MKKILFIFLILLISSCTSGYEELIYPPLNEVIESKSSEDNDLITDFYGEYITEDLKDLIGIYDYNCFYYQEDCNKPDRIDNPETWLIGKWYLHKDTLDFFYEGGNYAYGIIRPNSLIYSVNNEQSLFLRSKRVGVDVIVNPDFDDDLK